MQHPNDFYAVSVGTVKYHITAEREAAQPSGKFVSRTTKHWEGRKKSAMFLDPRDKAGGILPTVFCYEVADINKITLSLFSKLKTRH